MKQMDYITFFIFWFVLILGTSYIEIGLMEDVRVNTHYWNGKGIDMPLGAPDGVYDVLPNFFDSREVNFPICSHSYGQLHGSWQYDNSSGKVWFPTSEGWLTPCIVRLQNNLIVEAWKK